MRLLLTGQGLIIIRLPTLLFRSMSFSESDDASPRIERLEAKASPTLPLKEDSEARHLFVAYCFL